MRVLTFVSRISEGETDARGRGGFTGDAGGFGRERVRRRRDDEAIRNRKARAPQLAEIGAFAARLREVSGGQLIKRPNEHRPMLGAS